MSCVEDVLTGLKRSRRDVVARCASPPASPDVQILTPLDQLAVQLRSSRNGHDFSSLDLRYRSDLYDKAADMWLQNKASGFTYMMAAERVAFSYNLKFAECDRAKIKASICNRI